MLSSFIAIFASMAVALLAALMLLGGGLGEVSQAQVQAVRQSLPAPASAARQAGLPGAPPQAGMRSVEPACAGRDEGDA